MPCCARARERLSRAGWRLARCSLKSSPNGDEGASPAPAGAADAAAGEEDDDDVDDDDDEAPDEAAKGMPSEASNARRRRFASSSKAAVSNGFTSASVRSWASSTSLPPGTTMGMLCTCLRG